jgi:hypothetical protein
MIHDVLGRFHDNDTGAQAGAIVDIESISNPRSTPFVISPPAFAISPTKRPVPEPISCATTRPKRLLGRM